MSFSKKSQIDIISYGFKTLQISVFYVTLHSFIS